MKLKFKIRNLKEPFEKVFIFNYIIWRHKWICMVFCESEMNLDKWRSEMDHWMFLFGMNKNLQKNLSYDPDTRMLFGIWNHLKNNFPEKSCPNLNFYVNFQNNFEACRFWKVLLVFQPSINTSMPNFSWTYSSCGGLKTQIYSRILLNFCHIDVSESEL